MNDYNKEQQLHYHSEYLMNRKKRRRTRRLGPERIISALQPKNRICSGSCFSRIILAERPCMN